VRELILYATSDPTDVVLVLGGYGLALVLVVALAMPPRDRRRHRADRSPLDEMWPSVRHVIAGQHTLPSGVAGPRRETPRTLPWGLFADVVLPVEGDVLRLQPCPGCGDHGQPDGCPRCRVVSAVHRVRAEGQPTPAAVTAMRGRRVAR